MYLRCWSLVIYINENAYSFAQRCSILNKSRRVCRKNDVSSTPKTFCRCLKATCFDDSISVHWLYSGGVFQGAGSRNSFSCVSYCTLVTTIVPPVMHAADGCSRKYRRRKNKMNIQSSIPPGQAIPFTHFWLVLLGWRSWATNVFSLAAAGICSTHALLHILNRTDVPACPTGGLGYHASHALLERDLPAVSQPQMNHARAPQASKLNCSVVGWLTAGCDHGQIPQSQRTASCIVQSYVGWPSILMSRVLS